VRCLAFLIALAACNQDPVPIAPTGGRVELVPAPATGELAEYVAQEVARGSHDHVSVVVYVGATWCEPCRDFHTAAESGSLDASLGPMRFVELDLDRDGDRLKAAGYSSELVPLFARPLADGRASGTQTDGVRKGGNYVEQLTPRIKALFGP
jgi:thiol-disulfide isomerase/thioredoxin